MPESLDDLGGDEINVGNVQRSSAVAIGRGATAISYGLTVDEVATLVVELKNQDQPTVWNGRVLLSQQSRHSGQGDQQ